MSGLRDSEVAMLAGNACHLGILGCLFGYILATTTRFVASDDYEDSLTLESVPLRHRRVSFEEVLLTCKPMVARTVSHSSQAASSSSLGRAM